jgi:hypothetical protein
VQASSQWQCFFLRKRLCLEWESLELVFQGKSPWNLEKKKITSIGFRVKNNIEIREKHFRKEHGKDRNNS